MNEGHITQVIGPAVDVKFPPESLPNIYNALEVENPATKLKLVLEVAVHLGNDVVRAVALGPSEGLIRGLQVKDTGGPISVPVGPRVLGRLFNLLGETLDGREPVAETERWPIHRPAPQLAAQGKTTEIFETGLKVIDLLLPYPR
ncbi:MAG TPA: F0F1 ATP synthase subunit beta, partial [Candidatus Ozemobacteraceae bacterium]|nr:F0F1 ATP synthase subunit beta [Candidatus Ozemobacteraceae bacterium]